MAATLAPGTRVLLSSLTASGKLEELEAVVVSADPSLPVVRVPGRPGTRVVRARELRPFGGATFLP